ELPAVDADLVQRERRPGHGDGARRAHRRLDRARAPQPDPLPRDEAVRAAQPRRA
ncbi:CBN-UBC-25 protein, partial [Aphelenchoides avenae]